MTSFRPKSVHPRPPDTIPPRCFPGSSSATWSPSRAAATAVMTPPAVPPYTTRSNCGRAAAGCADAPPVFGAGYGSVSGKTRTPVVTFNGYLPPLGKLISTKNAVHPAGGGEARATHVLGPEGVNGVLW